MIRKVLTALVVSGVLLAPGCAESEQVNTADREAIEQIVREYILENPEIIEEAIIALSERQRLEAAAATKETIAENWDALYNDPTDYTIGPADAEITIVEFFDYRCGYCKRSVDWVNNLPSQYDGKVRVVFKELPIFGGVSESAALAALAAGRQGKYVDMHLALMKLKSNKDLTEEAIDQIAEEAGVDVTLMRADMKSLETQKQLSDMSALAQKFYPDSIPTPLFFIGDQKIEGANTPLVEALIESELAS